MFRYALRDLLRNPRRTIACLVGVILGVGLFSGVLFFIDGSGASMTKRALAPVAIDLQRVLTSPLGKDTRLTQRLATSGALATGERTRMILTLTNSGATTVNEVLVKDRLSTQLTYVPGSARRGVVRLPDVDGENPFSHGPGHVGHNCGTIAPGGTVRLSYAVQATRPIPAATRVPLNASVSTRENLAPKRSNPPVPVGLAELTRRIAQVNGVDAANELAFAQLPPGSLQTGSASVPRPVKVFGFDKAYAGQYPTIKLAAGSFQPGGALLSPTAARTLRVHTGDAVQMRLPGVAKPVTLRVSGVVDLSRARPLFNSREGNKLEDFLYLPDSIVLSPRAFEEIVVPAFRDAAAVRGSALAVKSPPTLEVDVRLGRAPLNADPGRALLQTGRIARDIHRIAPGQDYMLDNASNTLTVAKADAAVAKRMFLFLGLPGLLLAGFLSAYAGAVLAAAQRREQANLRLRGANRSHLTRIPVYRTVALAGTGSLLGAGAGLLSSLAVLGPSSLLEASPSALAVSAGIAIGAGLAATGLALYLPGRRALGRDVSGERRAMTAESQPAWRRWRLDYVAAAMATMGSALAVRNGAFDAPSGAVSTGLSTTLRSQLLLLPLAAWFVGTLLSARLFEGLARHLRVPRPPRFGPIVRGILARTLSRRSRPLVTGIVGVGLVVAFGLGLSIFAATYDASKAADAEFTVGSNLRITPSPLSRVGHPASYSDRLAVSGVSRATPVVASLENAFLRSTFNSDVQDLVAIDPAGYAKIAALSDTFFVGATAPQAMSALAAEPQNVLLDQATADGLKLHVGDQAEVLLARGTRHQKLRTMTVVGLFTRFPGFPEGVQIVANLDYYQSQTKIRDVDFFLAKTTDPRHAGLLAAARAIAAGPGRTNRLNIDSSETSLNKDQSSLTALNIRGLLNLDSFYTLAMSAVIIAIFVVGLMLHRRREYVILTAQGLGTRQLQALLLGEAAFVAVSGLLGGLLAGTGLGLLLVKVLQPLFILAPRTTIAVGDGALLAGLVLVATLISVAAALTILRALRPSEILREH